MLTGATAMPRSAAARPATDRRQIAARALLVARRTALGVLGDAAAADDVAQETAIVALRRIHQLRDPEALDAWVHRTAVRRALKEARRAGRRREAEIAGHELAERTAEPPADGPSPAADLDAATALLAGLPPRQRAALTLRYVHDLDDDAIATALGCRAGTVRSLLSRGRDALRDRDATGERPAGDASTGDGSAGDASTGNGSAGDASTGNGSAGETGAPPSHHAPPPERRTATALPTANDDDRGPECR